MRGKLCRAFDGFALLLLLAACAGPSVPAEAPITSLATRSASPTAMLPSSPVYPTALSPIPSTAPSSRPLVTSGPLDWIALIQSGDMFVVVFDETRSKFDDARYTGDARTDPLGPLQGAYAYRVRFSPADGWVTSGYNQAAGEIITAAQPAACASPAERQLCLWGIVLGFDEQGQVFDPAHGLVGHLSTSPQPTVPLPPVVPVVAEIETALWDYVRLRKLAEETLDPDLLAEVCVDPYLSWKTARIQENIRDGSRWTTPAAHFTVTSFLQATADTAVVRVEKRETKLFYPRGSLVPDDEICGPAIYSYRDCVYAIEYRMVRVRDRWYVSEATALGDCPSRCQPSAVTLPRDAIAPRDWPALPADLYFLRDGRLWRWSASGAGLQGLTAAGLEPVRDYALSPDGRYVAYSTASGALYALDAARGAQLFPAGGAAAPVAREYALLAGGRLLYVTAAGGLYVMDLASGAPILPPQGEEAAAVWRYSLTEDGRYLAYETTSGALYAADLEAGTLWPVPVEEPLAQFALTPDGQTVVYLTRHEFFSPRGDTQVYSGTLFAAAVGAAGRPSVLGACPARAGTILDYSCRGFLLSPDGQRVLYQDGQGIWVAQVPTGQPRLLAVSTNPEDGGDFCGARAIRAWMPDGRHMLMGILCYEGSDLKIVDTETGAEWPPAAHRGLGFCYVDCYRSWSVSAAGLWFSRIPGSLKLIGLQPDGTISLTWEISRTAAGPLWPTHLQPLPGGRLALAHQRCRPADVLEARYQPPAIFVVEADGTLRQGAGLPQVRCSESADYEVPFQTEIARSSVVWQADGAAFLYVDWRGWPLLLGTLDGRTLWDVRQALLGAGSFQWGK